MYLRLSRRRSLKRTDRIAQRHKLAGASGEQNDLPLIDDVGPPARVYTQPGHICTGLIKFK